MNVRVNTATKLNDRKVLRIVKSIVLTGVEKRPSCRGRPN